MFQMALLLGREPRGNPEIGQAGAAGGGVHDDVVGVEVLVNDVAPMNLGNGCGQLQGEVEKPVEPQRPPSDEGLEGAVPHILQHQGEPVPVDLQPMDLGDAGDAEPLDQLVLAAQTGGLHGGGILVDEALHDDGEPVAVAGRPIHDPLAAAVDLGLEGVARKIHREEWILREDWKSV